LKVSKNNLDLYFSSRPESFHKSEIEPERWEKFITNDENYFEVDTLMEITLMFLFVF
jgi:hypothetical protein